jgi:hypothetical protein
MERGAGGGVKPPGAAHAPDGGMGSRHAVIVSILETRLMI